LNLSNVNASLNFERVVTTRKGKSTLLQSPKQPKVTPNLLYPMKAALAAKATTGEVSDASRAAWGKYQPREFF